MGFEITCIDSSFRVRRPRSALAALKAENERDPLWSEWEEVQSALAAAKTLTEALTACCWDVEHDAEGRIDKLFYEGKRLTNIEEVARLFAVLAPYVSMGSFLVLRGENGAGWRFRFANGKLRMREQP